MGQNKNKNVQGVSVIFADVECWIFRGFINLLIN